MQELANYKNYRKITPKWQSQLVIVNEAVRVAVGLEDVVAVGVRETNKVLVAVAVDGRPKLIKLIKCLKKIKNND